MTNYIIDFKRFGIFKTEEIDVSPTELKILSILGCGEFVDIEDITKFIDINDSINVRMHIYRLKQKGFKIEAMQGAHSKYKLLEEVRFQ